MSTRSTKNLVLGLISLCTPIFMLIGLAISGGFSFRFYDIWVLISILDILALLVCIALIVINIVFLATSKTLRVVEMLSVIVAPAIMFLRMLVYLVVVSILASAFIFPTYYLIAVLLTAVPTIVYFVCNVKLADNTKGETMFSGNDTAYTDSVYDADGKDASVCNDGDDTKMSDRQIDTCIMAVKDFVPADKLLYLRSELEKGSGKTYNLISTLSLKKPITVLLFSIFLGGLGVDRFYIGDTLIGVLKLLFGWLTGYIWIIVDIFLCNKKIKEKNLQEIMSCIRR